MLTWLSDYLERVISLKDPVQSLFFACVASTLFVRIFVPEERRHGFLRFWQFICRGQLVVILVLYQSPYQPPWFLDYFRIAPSFLMLLWLAKNAENELLLERMGLDSKGKSDAKLGHSHFNSSTKGEALKESEPPDGGFTLNDFDMLLASGLAYSMFCSFFYLLVKMPLMTAVQAVLLINVFPRMLGEYLEFRGVGRKLWRLIVRPHGGHKNEKQKES